MEYKVVRKEERDDLEHGLFGNKGGAKLGSTWDNHKYIARQKVGDGWRYFYSQAELRAAQAKQAGKNAASAVGNAAKSVAGKASGAVRSGVASVKRSTADARRKLDKSTADIRTRAYEAVGDLKADAKKFKKNATRTMSDWDSEVVSRYNTAKTNLDTTWMKTKKNISEFDAKEAAKKAGETVGSAVKKAGDTAKSAAATVGSAAKKAGEAAVSTAKKAGEAVKDFRDYADNVDKRYKEARDTVDTENLREDMKRFERDNATESLDAKRAVDAENDAEAARRTKRNAEKAAEEAEKESNSFKYKASNAIRSSIESAGKFVDSGKAAASKLLGKAGDAAGSAASKGKAWLSERMSPVTSKIDAAKTERNKKKLMSNALSAVDKAESLGRRTDELSDKAEQALQQYGRNSIQYKKAYDNLTNAFEDLEKAEADLSSYESQIKSTGLWNDYRAARKIPMNDESDRRARKYAVSNTKKK